MKTPQFWLLFWVLCLNVTAGIGVLGQASVMIQELFSEASVGKQAAISGGGGGRFRQPFEFVQYGRTVFVVQRFRQNRT